MILSKLQKAIICQILTVFFLLMPTLLLADPFTQNDCRKLQPIDNEAKSPSKYVDALLWKVTSDNRESSYIFGTIHVSDPRIVKLPQPVSELLNTTDIFAMEALPEPEESLKLSQMMFFADGRTLKDYIDDSLFNKTAKILSAYEFPPEAVMLMKPWAAFLIMNYPAGEGLPLDIQLLNRAKQNGAEIHGLESLSEQGDIFSTMSLGTQVQLLMDTVCNYDSIYDDFETMKLLYLNKDLKGLFIFSNKYSLTEEPLYKDLMKRLLTDRNYIMADRMQSILQKGNAFIAIGAMHLPGEEGVLSLLKKQGYKIHSVY